MASEPKTRGGRRRLPQDERTQLQELEVLHPDTLLLVWKDGHETLYRHRALRESCACAACVDEWSSKAILDPATLPEDLTILRCDRTGRYGLNIAFSDGHSSGIYSLRSLRDECPCRECTLTRGKPPQVEGTDS
ncbi:MAG TPA: DUF971 domain-containing protein [Planctomycetes bacterium]|nr:DUF971 domain-containing protein [Planctomycetota bacterium]